MTRHHNQPVQQQETEEEEYYVYPILEGSDYREHTPARPFCSDPTCPDKDDQDLLEQLQQWYQEGLIGPIDGDLIYRGHTV